VGTKTLDVEMLAKMFIAGAWNLEANKEHINELNVFPVPDGDTGTNMTLTIQSAVKEVMAISDLNMGSISKAISSGSLRGARGNSGVILSQLLRGFTKSIQELETIDAMSIAAALGRARDTAYKAVMKPKEGTILTVASGIAEEAARLSLETDDLEELFPAILKHAEEVLEKTPDLLPVLKEAGVVDSGGKGLVVILKGAYDAFLGKEVEYTTVKTEGKAAVYKAPESEEESDIKFGYCTEFIILTNKTFSDKDEDELKSFLSGIGDSIVCVADDEVVKIHVHTNDPGLAIQKGLSYGALSRMKIDNMREEHHERVIKEAEKLAKEQEEQAKKKTAPKKSVGIISVSAGEGIKEIFTELGVDYIIEGGQTMNPSTEDVLEAIEKVWAETVFILPNNKNIILAADQARDLSEDTNVIVIPTKTVPQGISAVISFSQEAEISENEEAMKEAAAHVKSGQVTYAVRDTTIEQRQIHEGDIMGLGDKGILSLGNDIGQTAKELVRALVDDDSEIISIYYGAEVEKKAAENFGKEIEAAYPELDVVVQYGGQPVYYYVVAVE
jgi:DAK2 domain fusion protein YloV